MTNHLWQSTLFAVLAGLLTVALRKNRAQVRYWLWLSASLKFLVPFALLMSLGSQLEWTPAAQTIAKPVLVIEQIAQPFPETVSFVQSTPSSTDWIPSAILAVWVCGFAAIALIRFRGWFRIRAAVRSSKPVRHASACRLQVRSSPGLLEPGVVGLWNPILLLPAGIEQHLPPSQLEAVLAHEQCHVRRRDNLLASIHMIVEALFWFHPLVWWIGSRLVEERERACDEEVLRLGSEPRVYAESILNVCKLYVESPLTCVSGITGSNLKERIRAIMSESAARDLNFAKKAALAVAGVVVLAAPIIVGMLNTPRLQAQSPAFEAVSIKLNKSGDLRTSAVAAPDRGTYTAENHSVKQLIRQAYGLKNFQLEGGPKWIDDNAGERFDIIAKAAGPVSKDQLMRMLQVALEDRFKFTFRRETRQPPVYALVVAKKGVLGPNLHEPTPREFRGSPVRGAFAHLEGQNATMQDLASYLSGLNGRLVVDRTDLTDHYDFTLESVQETPNTAAELKNLNLPPPPENGPSLFTALQEQLGLKLESARGPVEIMIVDRVERPSEN